MNISDRVGRLVIVNIFRVGHKGYTKRAVCKCDCGTIKEVLVSHLSSGKTRSCGCLQKELSISRQTTHGQSAAPQTRMYTIWMGMKARCLNPSEPAFKNYGGRGITICKRWMKFENFFADMGTPPDGKMIDRINNNGNYNKNNCKWSTRKEQNRNTRKNHFVLFRGEMVPLSVVAEQTPISYATILYRIAIKKMSVEEAITKPLRKKNKKTLIMVDGQQLSIKEFSEKNNVPYDLIRGRIIKLGWSVEDAISTPKYQKPKKGA